MQQPPVANRQDRCVGNPRAGRVSLPSPSILNAPKNTCLVHLMPSELPRRWLLSGGWSARFASGSEHAPHLSVTPPAKWTASDAMVSEPCVIVKPPPRAVKADSCPNSETSAARRLPNAKSPCFNILHATSWSGGGRKPPLRLRSSNHEATRARAPKEPQNRNAHPEG